MDTSKEYILMCEKAEEIQDLRLDEDKEFIGDEKDFWTLVGIEKNIYVWLPRQDQLQEMIEGCFVLKRDEDGFTANWTDEYSPRWFFFKPTVEQALLEMIMRLKYNKRWNGKEWQIST